MASLLRYDTALMRESARKYDTIATKMIRLKTGLDKQIKSLVDSDWQSDAGEAFDKTYASDWCENVDKYSAVLNEYADMLRSAADEYDQVTRTARQVTI